MEVFILCVLAFFIFFAWRGERAVKEWETWPTVDQYLDGYNPSQGRGIVCYKCGSSQIWEEGFDDKKSRLRIHFCKQCKTYLYRTER